MSTILAIEAAVAGGSASVWVDNVSSAAWIGDGHVSTAEQLLPAIDTILATARVAPGDLDSVAVSNGPGSFTGIRIGIATALGLSAALKIPCIGLSCLEAVARTRSLGNPMTVVIPFGSRDVAWQRFVPSGAIFMPVAERTGRFLERRWDTSEVVLAHADLSPLLSEENRGWVVTDIGRDLSAFIGLAADDGSNASPPAALYVQRNVQSALNQAT